jgi:hypothetical protein
MVNNSNSKSSSGKTTITLGGKMDYPDPSSCCYLSYPCAYCLDDFILVDPYHNFESGGAIQREVIERDTKTGEIIKIGRIRGVCVNYAKAMIRLEYWRDPFANTCHCIKL